jgi:hypothetical protein
MPELGAEHSLPNVCLQLLSMLAGAVLVALVLRVPNS